MIIARNNKTYGLGFSRSNIEVAQYEQVRLIRFCFCNYSFQVAAKSVVGTALLEPSSHTHFWVKSKVINGSISLVDILCVRALAIHVYESMR